MGNAFFRDFDLLVLGELFMELHSPEAIADASAFTQRMGGSDIYTAVAAARQGAKTGLISSIARDPFAKRIREQLAEESINTDYVISSSGYNGLYFIDDESPDKREYLFHRPGTGMIYRAAASFIGVEPVWDEKSVLAECSPSAIHWDSTTRVAGVLLAACDILGDDRRFRELAELHGDNRIAYFNRLRKEYPQRLEFCHYSVLNCRNSEDRRILSLLGFTVL